MIITITITSFQKQTSRMGDRSHQHDKDICLVPRGNTIDVASGRLLIQQKFPYQFVAKVKRDHDVLGSARLGGADVDSATPASCKTVSQRHGSLLAVMQSVLIIR